MGSASPPKTLEQQISDGIKERIEEWTKSEVDRLAQEFTISLKNELVKIATTVAVNMTNEVRFYSNNVETIFTIKDITKKDTDEEAK